MRLIRHARCTGSSLDPDQWFPVSEDIGKARQEAAAAITMCTACLVRAECLAVALRHPEIGQHGVWGGLVAAERVTLPRRRPGAVLRTPPGRRGQAPRPSIAVSGVAGPSGSAGLLNETGTGRRIRGGTGNDEGPGTG